MKNSVITVYQADGNAQTAFGRLNDVYNSNYIENAVYGAVIDLPPAVCYRTVSDVKISENAKRYFEEMRRGKKGRFFCAVRQRRYISDASELKKYRISYARFACEGGAKGALSAIIDIKTEGTEGFFAYYGTSQFFDCDKVYLSGYDENGEKGVLPYPGTVNALFDRFDGKNTILPKIITDKRSFFDPSEGVYAFEKGHNGVATECRFCAGVCRDIVTHPKIADKKRLVDAVLYGVTEKYRMGEIYSVSDATLTMCTVVALKELGRLGAMEAFEMSENVFDRLRERLFSSEFNGNDGECAFLLTVLSGAYKKLSEEYPEFMFLKNDARETAEVILRHSANGGGYGFFCSREYSKRSETERLSFIAKTVIFGSSAEELKAFLNTRAENVTSDTRTLAVTAVWNAQEAFFGYLKAIPELEYKIRYLRLTGADKGYYDALNAYGTAHRPRAEKMIETQSFYPVRMRFAECGCDITLLPFASYIEKCRAYQNRIGEKENTLTLFTDRAYPIVKLLLRAAAIDPKAVVCVVTRDGYSHNALKKASSGRARLITRSECSAKAIKEASAVTRQITPYTVLSELLTELEQLEKG